MGAASAHGVLAETFRVCVHQRSSSASARGAVSSCTQARVSQVKQFRFRGAWVIQEPAGMLARIILLHRSLRSIKSFPIIPPELVIYFLSSCHCHTGGVELGNDTNKPALYGLPARTGSSFPNAHSVAGATAGMRAPEEYAVQCRVNPGHRQFAGIQGVFREFLARLMGRWKRFGPRRQFASACT